MNVCILGWYGTETLGDRAILDGIIKIFENKQKGNRYFLGSLIPFFSERTMYYDRDIYQIEGDAELTIFCEKDKNELINYINKTDYLIMGGGPIMDISEIYIIRKAFMYAKQRGIKTAIVGCGYGPFHDQGYWNIAREILAYSDVLIFRDKFSEQRAHGDAKGKRTISLSDPAVISALVYRENNPSKRKEYIAINYRDTRFKTYRDKIVDDKQNICNLTNLICNNFSEVYLVPMHTFYWGGDDRRYFAELCQECCGENVEIVFKPQSLYDLYSFFSNAFGCIGMRYHSVVLQTILNGNNVVLDYTEPRIGKVSAFMSETDQIFFENRIVNLTEGNWWKIENFVHALKSGNRFYYSACSNRIIDEYITELF